MSLSPDGTVFFTLEEIPGVYERQPKQVVSLWDVQTGQARPLPDRLFSTGPFSPDSRTFAAKVTEENGYTQALKLFDVASGREKWTVPIPEKTAKAYFTGFSPDGRLLAGEYRVFDQPQKWDHWQSRVKIWETAHGREVLSSVPARDSVFYNAQFSPDSRVLAVTNWKSETGKLLLFRPGDNQPPRVIILGQTPRGQRLLSIKPEFRGDGKWLALITQVVPEVRSGATDARDYPQPRIHLIDVAAGEIRETLVAPPAFARCASFSPDGTLRQPAASVVCCYGTCENCLAPRVPPKSAEAPSDPKILPEGLQIGADGRLFGELQQTVGIGDLLDSMHQVHGHRAQADFENPQKRFLHPLSDFFGDQFVQQRGFDHGFFSSKNSVQGRIVVNQTHEHLRDGQQVIVLLRLGLFVDDTTTFSQNGRHRTRQLARRFVKPPWLCSSM